MPLELIFLESMFFWSQNFWGQKSLALGFQVPPQTKQKQYFPGEGLKKIKTNFDS